MSKEQSLLVAVSNTLGGSPLSRLAAIAILTVSFLLPIAWIGDLVSERMARRDVAVVEVSQKWGAVQRLTGPALVVPYTHKWTERDGKAVVEKSQLRTLTILPSELSARARIDGAERYRGIFAVPVYRASVEIGGVFAMPSLADLRIDPALVEWSRSQLVLGIADVHAIQSRATAAWGGAELPFRSGPGSSDLKAGIHAPIAKPFAGPMARFVLQVDLNGSSGLYFTPVGEQTTVTVDSNWPSPSFQGNWLPGEHSIGADGFRARWQIPFLGRNQAPAWTSASPHTLSDLGDAAFGVDLVTPVDAHRMSERSVKYARLFVLLTFGVIWLIEVLTGVRVHPIQYLLIGGALCTFYLLELSLAEHLGFATAYLLAGTAVVGLVGLYAAVALRGWSRALAVGCTIGGLYGYLYVLLTNEDYALLLGSLGVFAAVAVTMLLTRKVDWYAERPADPEPRVPPTAPAARA